MQHEITTTFTQPFNDSPLQGDYTDDQIIEMFLAVRCKSSYTQRNYSKAIEKFRKFISHKSLRQVTWREVEAYKIGLIKGYCSITGKPQAQGTVAGLLAPLRSLYKWGSDPNIAIFPHNPTTSVQSPKVSINSQNHYLTRSEAGELLEQLKNQGDRNYLIGLALILLGLRVSELVAVRPSDFHYDPSGKFTWLTVVNGKGGKRREVKVPNVLWEPMLPYIGKQSVPALETAENANHKIKDKPIFPISIRQVERIIAEAALQCGLGKKVTPHWLRHTNATLALLYGASLQQVQESLGHSHMNTTQRYLHTVEQLKKAAPDFVEDSLRDFF